jgi:NADH-quinone oxidoreductase subunit M
MSLNFPFLTTLLLIPALSALFILLFIKNDSDYSVNNINTMGFWATLLNFTVSIVILLKFDFQQTNFQFSESYLWIPAYDIGYRVALDNISLLLILLTTSIMPLCMIFSKNSIKFKQKEYVISFLLLESFIIGTFIATDLLLFYIFFETTLIPMFIIIGIWGGKERIYAAYKFFLYTFFGSILFLLAIITIIITAKTSNLIMLYEIVPVLFKDVSAHYLWFGFFIAFAIKMPMFPFHTWLPDAHVQAPTAGSVILAAILLKMGAYGLIRFSLPFFPESSIIFKDLVYYLSVIAIIYTSIIACSQTDIKKLIAYSSVAHMGYVTLGIFTFEITGMVGAIFQMISHGIISGALFFMIGMIYDRLHTRDINQLGGIANIMPNYSIFFVVITLGSIALPATSGFIGEFLVLLAIYKVNPAFMIFAALGVVLGAVYMLRLVKYAIMGEVHNHEILKLKDIKKEEFLILLPFATLVIVLGVYPALINDIINPAISNYFAELIPNK